MSDNGRRGGPYRRIRPPSEQRSVLQKVLCPICQEGTVLISRTDVLAAPEIGALAGEIIEELAREYGVTAADLVGPRRFKRLTEPRYKAYFRMRYGLSMTLKSIGAIMGERDHSTIINGLNQINAAGEYEPKPPDRRPVAVE